MATDRGPVLNLLGDMNPCKAPGLFFASRQSRSDPVSAFKTFQWDSLTVKYGPCSLVSVSDIYIFLLFKVLD